MKINVHVREKVICVECGEGTQKVSWLGSVGVARYDSNFGVSLGKPLGIRQEGGTIHSPSALICSELKDDQHVFVVLKGDFDT